MIFPVPLKQSYERKIMQFKPHPTDPNMLVIKTNDYAVPDWKSYDLESVFNALGLSVIYGVVGDTQRRFVRIKDKDGNLVFSKMEKNS